MLGGGAYRRPGTLYDNRKSSATYYAPAVFPFIYSESEAYVVEIGKSIAGTGYVDITRTSDTDSAGTGTTVSPNTHDYDEASVDSGVTSYDQWHEIQYAQSADIMYLVHPKRKPLRINRTATDTFTVREFDYNLTGTTFRDAWPYRSINATATTLSVSDGTVGTGRTLTASTAIFYSTHVGAVFKINNGADYGCVRVTSIGAGPYPITTCTVEVMVRVDSATPPATPTTAVTTWWESVWSDYRGWPRSICFFQDRLVYGGNESQPDDIWCSETGDYNQLSVSDESDPYGGPTTSEPFTMKLLSTRLNKVQWLLPGKTLFVGTQGDEWIIDRETTGPFGADNSKFEVQSSYGSSYNQVFRAGNEVIFNTQGGGDLRALIFNDTEDAYIGEPIQVLYEDFPEVDTYAKRTMRRMQWDKFRDTLWCLDTMGNFRGLTRDRRLGVSAWHQHEFGGYDESVLGSALDTGSGTTLDPIYTQPTGSVVSFCVVPNTTTGVNDVWFVIQRKINGTFYWMLERMIGKAFPLDTAYENLGYPFYFADACAVDLNEYPAAEDYILTGFAHLQGETLVGASIGTNNGIFAFDTQAVPASGNVTMNSPYPGGFTAEAHTLHAGLSFDCIVEPVRIEAGSQIGTAQGAIKRIHEVHIRFYKTLAAKVGRDSSNLETILFRTGSLAMGLSPELFSGDKKVKLDGDYDRDGLVYILCDQPLPFGVLSVVAEGMTYDG